MMIDEMPAELLGNHRRSVRGQSATLADIDNELAQSLRGDLDVSAPVVLKFGLSQPPHRLSFFSTRRRCASRFWRSHAPD